MYQNPITMCFSFIIILLIFQLDISQFLILLLVLFCTHILLHNHLKDV
nr:MAG TPA: hypothetical protein [Bacteriophage sp.]